MIYHILPASVFHLTPKIVERLSLNTLDSQRFIVIGNSSFDYIAFKSENNLNLEIFDSCKSFVDFFEPNKEDLIFLHGDSYKRMFFFLVRLYKNIHWVCWGSGTKVNKSIKSIVSYFVKLVLYRLLKGCICLSIKDLEDLKHYFFIKNSVLMNYPIDINFQPQKIEYSTREKDVIYFGNNPACLIANIKLLPKIPNSYEYNILFMLNYCLDGYTKQLEKLKQISKDCYENSIIIYTNFLNLNDYYDFMDQCTVYICNETTQSGLGAIFTCIKLGKKLYLNGNNYDYITSLGIHVNHVNELHSSSKDVLKQYDYKTKQSNLDILNEHLNFETLLIKWKKYYSLYS